MKEFTTAQANLLSGVESAVQDAVANALANVRDHIRTRMNEIMTDEVLAHYYPHDSMTQDERAVCVNEWTDDLLGKSINSLASIYVKASIEKKAGLG
jgi:hypothetical protein